MTLRFGDTAGRTRTGVPATTLLVLLCAGLVACGCARQVPLTELGPSGAVVWVRLATSDGEQLTGQVVSLDAGSMVIALRHALEGDVRVRERDGDKTASAWPWCTARFRSLTLPPRRFMRAGENGRSPQL